MNGPQCLECGGFNECNHGVEPPPCCPVCEGAPGERDDLVCDACDRALAERYEAARDARRFGNDTAVVRYGR
jgi:hypothetical protein